MVIMSTIEQDQFPEDLILDILSRLPSITLLRFKSVSKTWCSLISDPDFCRRHTALHHHHMLEEEPSPPEGILLLRKFCVGDSDIVIQHPHFPSGLVDHKQKNFALLLRNLNDYRPGCLNESWAATRLNKENFKLADSCNGLLLYIKGVQEDNKYCETFYVCNPITKNYIKLPTIDMDIDDEFKEHELVKGFPKIVFNPSFSLTYKVFTWVHCAELYSISRPRRRRLYVYSSETRSWRYSVSIPLTDTYPLFRYSDLKAVLWNGVLHWTTSGHPCKANKVFCVCYDIEKETVWTMKCPNIARRLIYFGLCGESLLFISNNDLGYCVPTSFDVMEKQHNRRDGNGEDDMWSVRYHVNFKEIDYNYYLKPKGSSPYSSILDIYRTMGRNKINGDEEEEEMLLIKLGTNNKMISFSLTNNTFGIEELSNIKNHESDNLYYTSILRYTITLYPP